MMKMIMAVLALTLSISAWASTGETQFIEFDGSSRSNAMTLLGTKTHTEYRYEQVRSTCYRREIVGYRNVCSRVVVGQNCRVVNNQRRCTPVYQQRCRRVAVYRTYPYVCYQTVRIPYEVFDYNVKNEVNFSFADLPAGSRADVQIQATSHGDELSVKANDRGNELILFYNKNQTVSFEGDTKVVNTHYNISFMDLEKATSAFRSGVQVNNIAEDKIVLFVGEMSDELNYNFRLNIEKRKFLRRNPTLIDRALAGSEVKVESLGNGLSSLTLDLAKLGVNLAKGRYKVNFTMGLETPESRILNSSQVPSLSLKMKKKVKIKKNGSYRVR